MTVTYKTNDAFPGIKFPRLHRVTYDRRLDESIAAGYQRSLKDHHVDTWLGTHCRHPYYRSPGYIREKFIEFECDEDAAFFALRWGV